MSFFGSIASGFKKVVGVVKKVAAPAAALGALAAGAPIGGVAALGGLAGKLGAVFGKKEDVQAQVTAAVERVEQAAPVIMSAADPTAGSSSSLPRWVVPAAVLGGLAWLLKSNGSSSRRW